eukprot:217823_1
MLCPPIMWYPSPYYPPQPIYDNEYVPLIQQPTHDDHKSNNMTSVERKENEQKHNGPPPEHTHSGMTERKVISLMASLLNEAIPLNKTIQSTISTSMNRLKNDIVSEMKKNIHEYSHQLTRALGGATEESFILLNKDIAQMKQQIQTHAKTQDTFNHQLAEIQDTQSDIFEKLEMCVPMIQSLKDSMQEHNSEFSEQYASLNQELQDIAKNTSKCKTISKQINNIKTQLCELDESHTTLKLDLKNNIETSTTAMRATEEHVDGMSLLMLSNQTNAANALSELEVALSQCSRDSIKRHVALNAALETNLESIKDIKTSMKNSMNALESKLTESIKQTMEISSSLTSDADAFLGLGSDIMAAKCDGFINVKTGTSETILTNIRDMTPSPQAEPVITQILQSIIDKVVLDDTQTSAATPTINTNEDSAMTHPSGSLSSTINDKAENNIMDDDVYDIKQNADNAMDDAPISLCGKNRGSTQKSKTKTGTHNGKAVRKRNRNKNKKRTKQATARSKPNPKPNKPHRIALTDPAKRAESWHEDMAVHGGAYESHGAYSHASKQTKTNVRTQHRSRPTIHKPQQEINQRQQTDQYRAQYDTYRTRQSTNTFNGIETSAWTPYPSNQNQYHVEDTRYKDSVHAQRHRRQQPTYNQQYYHTVKQYQQQYKHY